MYFLITFTSFSFIFRDIPYASTFRIVDRWIIELIENNETQDSNLAQDVVLYTSKLTVHAEVVMLKSCTWETQIRKKASETITDMVEEWVRTALMALKATEQQKEKRLNSCTESVNDFISLSPPSIPSSTITKLTLFEKHRRNFQKLEKIIAKGDLEW